MMKTNHSFDYAFNAQAVVDEKSQVVLAGESPKRPATSTSSSR